VADPISVTRTKIIVPRRRSELLSRQRLLSLMDDLLENKLTILAAPAGYGKTSLMIDFVHHSGMPVCWYALDSLDQEPLRFISYLIASISLRFPRFGRRTLAALQAVGQGMVDLEALAPMIINDAYENITEHFAIVLDDYHLVEESREINLFINRLVQEVDENCHLIIASRTLLTLPDLPLLVARSQVGGLSFEELAFQPAEIQSLLLQNYQLTVSDADASELARVTEGWITGLLLSTQSVGAQITERLRTSRVSGVGLYDYLAQQVLNQQPKVVQQFLLRTSLLEEFDAELCEEVLGPALSSQEDWQDLMETVMHHNLFILPVGEESLSLRYHHLFRDFLQNRLQQQYPEEALAIRRRLGEVYAHREEWERAYEIYRKLGDVEATAGLLKRAGAPMVMAGRLNTLAGWLENLPDEKYTDHPSLISLRGAVNTERGDIHRSIELLNQAISILKGQSEKNDLCNALVRRATAYRMKGDYRAAEADAKDALALCEGEDELQISRADALFELGMNVYFQGKASQALGWLERALKAYQVLGDQGAAAKVFMQIGVASRVTGKFDAAEKAYQRALTHYQATGNYIWQANLYNNLGVLYHLRGDYESAVTALSKTIQYARLGGAPRLEAYALASIGDVYRDLEALSQSLEAYRQARQIGRRTTDHFLLFYLDLVEACVMRVQGKMAHSRQLLHSAQHMAEDSGSKMEQRLCQLEWGSFYLSDQNYSSAIDVLKDVACYFDDEGQPSEAIRSHLLLAVAYHALKDYDSAQNHFQKIGALLSSTENQHLAVIASREVKPMLQKMHTNVEYALLVGSLLAQLDHFEQVAAEYRRSLRRQTLVVPFSPPRIIIRTLGKMQVKVGDRILTNADWQGQVAPELFFLLLAHPDGLTKEEIIDIFWVDLTLDESRLRFKNAIYRLRHAAGKDVIVFDEEVYRFNSALDYEYDAEIFQREVRQTESVEDREKQILHYRNAIKIYKGDYLPELGSYWVVTERERLQQLYMETLLKLAGLYLEKRQYEAALSCCQRAIGADPYQEEAYRMAMRVYAAMGNRAAVVRQYEQCNQALQEGIGIPPSEQTRTLYEVLIR